MSDKITVVIPAYNAQEYISDAINSIKQQSYHNISIIVVDDGSTDETVSVAQKFAGVSIIHQSRGGAAAARNAGILASDGEYLAFLDADDVWTPDKIQKQLSIADAEIVAGKVEEFQNEQTVSRLKDNMAYTIGAMLIRRNDFLKVGLLNASLLFGEFIDWRSRAESLGFKEVVLDHVVLRRRIHNTNTTSVSVDKRQHYLDTVRQHLNRKKNSG